MAFLSLSKALVASMPKDVYDRVKDQFPPYEVLDVSGYDGGVEVLFDDTKEIQIIDKRGLNEIKVLSPSPFRVEVESNDQESEGYYIAKSYFNDTLLDEDTVVNEEEDYIYLYVPVELYSKIKNQLPPHESNSSYAVTNVRGIMIKGIDKVNMVYKEGQLQEIKVVPPSPFRVEVYLHDDDPNEDYWIDYNAESYFNNTLLDDDTIVNNKEGHIIVDIPSEIYKTIKNQLPPHKVIPHRVRFTRIKIEGLKNINMVYKEGQLQEIKVLPPSPFRFEVTRLGTQLKEGKLFFNDILLDNDALVFEDQGFIAAHIPTKIYDTIESILPPHDIMSISAKAKGNAIVQINDLSNIRVIDNLSEIRINKPNSTLRFEAATNTSSDSAHISGTLYLGNKRLDDKVIWFKPGKRMHVTLPLETYYSIKDQLPSYEEVYEYTSSVHKGMRVIDIYLNDLSDVEIVDDEDPLNEIKVVPPVGPGKLRVEGPYMNFGGWAGYIRSKYNPGLPIKDKFVDVLTDYIKVYFTMSDDANFESNFNTFTNYLKRKNIKFTSNKLTYRSNGEEYYLVEIPKSQIEFVNRQGLVTEIKVVAPGIISTLENYHSKIRATQDDNTKKELVLRCADLVLPIFEKSYPNDDRLRKAIEAAKAYLLDPTEENKETLRVAKSGASSANVAAYHNGYNEGHAAVVASAAICLSADTIYNYLQVAESAANSAIRAAKLDQNLQEIKVVPPQRRIDPDEYEVIYQLLQGDRKPSYLDDEIWGIDFDLISREYFTNPNPIFMEPERYEEMAEYLDKNNMLLAFRALPIIELDNPNVHFEDNEAKYPKQQYYILKHDNKFYFVDSQGANYPRYVTYLKNFPL
jgi:hypothetical protein